MLIINISAGQIAPLFFPARANNCSAYFQPAGISKKDKKIYLGD